MLMKEIERKKQMVKFAQNFFRLEKGGIFMKSKYVMIGGLAFSAGLHGIGKPCSASGSVHNLHLAAGRQFVIQISPRA